MKIDFSTLLVSAKKEPLETITKVVKEKCETCGQLKTEKIQMSLGYGCYEALSAVVESDKNETGEDKYKRGKLGEKIINAIAPIDISAEDIVLIKERVGQLYGPVPVVVIYDLLEGKKDGE